MILVLFFAFKSPYWSKKHCIRPITNHGKWSNHVYMIMTKQYSMQLFKQTQTGVGVLFNNDAFFMTSAKVKWINNYVHPCCISRWLTGWNPPTSVEQWGRLPGRSEPLQTDLAGSSAQAIRQSSTSSDRCSNQNGRRSCFWELLLGPISPSLLRPGLQRTINHGPFL